MSKFNSISPIEFRYGVPAVAMHLCDASYLRHKLSVELAIAQALHKLGKCDKTVVDDIAVAIQQITPEAAAALEKQTGHDIVAMTQAINQLVEPSTQRFVHRFATSYDIVETARARQYRDVTDQVFLPALEALMKQLYIVIRRETDTLQIGRSHGQAGLPITFSFALSWYLERLGLCRERVIASAHSLVGKFSGAMGGYNALTFFGMDPREFERLVLEQLNVKPGAIATQIVTPEPLKWLLEGMCDVSGVVANIARDFRCLQRSEIDEIREPRTKGAHGSSTMKGKRNPVKCENVESIWTILFGLRTTLQFDQISEHQRDLTGSARSRTYPEIVNYVVYMLEQMALIVEGLEVNHKQMTQNILTHAGVIVGEPLYLILGELGYPDAPNVSKDLCFKARDEGTTPLELMKANGAFTEYLARMTEEQLHILEHPEEYIGLCKEQALAIADKYQALVT